jgi:hypothetical protein
MTIIIVVVCILVVFSVYFWLHRKGIFIKSNVDQKEYFVRNVSLEYNQKAADTLANINKNISILLEVLKNQNNGIYQKNIDLLLSRFNKETLMENILQIDTTFTIDKGLRIEMCISDSNNNIYDINTLMFVILHELGHCASITYDHTPEFYRNFAYITRQAINVGVYKYIDYSKSPLEYCGMTVNNSIIKL